MDSTHLWLSLFVHWRDWHIDIPSDWCGGNVEETSRMSSRFLAWCGFVKFGNDWGCKFRRLSRRVEHVLLDGYAVSLPAQCFVVKIENLRIYNPHLPQLWMDLSLKSLSSYFSMYFLRNAWSHENPSIRITNDWYQQNDREWWKANVFLHAFPIH